MGSMPGRDDPHARCQRLHHFRAGRIEQTVVRRDGDIDRSGRERSRCQCVEPRIGTRIGPIREITRTEITKAPESQAKCERTGIDVGPIGRGEARSRIPHLTQARQVANLELNRRTSLFQPNLVATADLSSLYLRVSTHPRHIPLRGHGIFERRIVIFRISGIDDPADRYRTAEILDAVDVIRMQMSDEQCIQCVMPHFPQTPLYIARNPLAGGSGCIRTRLQRRGARVRCRASIDQDRGAVRRHVGSGPAGTRTGRQ